MWGATRCFCFCGCLCCRAGAALRRRLEGPAAAGAPLAFVDPHAATDDELLRVHDRAYVGRVLSGTLTAAEVPVEQPAGALE